MTWGHTRLLKGKGLRPDSFPTTVHHGRRLEEGPRSIPAPLIDAKEKLQDGITPNATRAKHDRNLTLISTGAPAAHPLTTLDREAVGGEGRGGERRGDGGGRLTQSLCMWRGKEKS